MPETARVIPVEVLPYPDLLARRDVAVERLPGSVRVVVPPVRWRELGTGYFVSVPILLAVIVLYFVAMPREAWASAAITYGVPIVIILLVALGRLTRRTIVTVSTANVSIACVSTLGSGRWMVWPRADVIEIRLNRVNAKLIVRVRGSDFVEAYLGPSAEVNAAVVDVLEAALRDVPRAAGPGTADDPALPPARPGAEKLRRRLLVATGTIMLAGGLALLALPGPAGVLAFYTLLGSAVPFGIAYGTQKKEFYV